MRRVGIAFLIGLLGCSSPAPIVRGDPLAFRVVREGQSATSCVDEPDFLVAMTEDDWIDVFDLETGCQPDTDIDLPRVNFNRRFAIAAWWRVEGCLGWEVETATVEITDGDVTVRATSSGPGPQEVCATAVGTLRSFLSVKRPDVPIARARFVLDDIEVGIAEAL